MLLEKRKDNILDYQKYPTKRYKHIDTPKNIRVVENYIKNPDSIEKHGFLPLIKDELIAFKWRKKKSNNENHKDKKEREIAYAGHLDNFIYKCYSEKLNKYYNTFLIENKLDEIITAYRTNKTGKSNIDFSAEIINAIAEYEECYILIGDFTDFFSNIKHSKLKENLYSVCNISWLSKDWFNVMRSATKYGYYDKKYLDNNVLIDETNELNSKRSNPDSYFNSVKSFRKFQRKFPCKSNKNDYGIPQGLAISGVFANIACLDFDQSLQNICLRKNGIYRRYSDDFIMVIPKSHRAGINRDYILKLREEIIQLASDNYLTLNAKKTNTYMYKNRKIYNIDTNVHDNLDYLGFVFDGINVRMREKSIYKFYRKAYKLINKARVVQSRKNLNKIPYKRKIYRLYTDFGVNESDYGNFINYAKRSQSKFDKISPITNNMMNKQIQNRNKKIFGKINK